MPLNKTSGRRSFLGAAGLCAAALLGGGLGGPDPARGAEPDANPRAARSVHLGYPAADAAVFYNEMIVEQSTPGSYFMAAGWNTGYFGIQELADGRKVILFSVWDPTQGDDPRAVKTEDRVECLFSAPDVRIRRFGGEGTGGQCMGDFAWKLGETNRFVVTAAAEEKKTVYSGYVWRAGKNEWQRLVTFRTRTGGQWLRGLYSFVEDFRRDHKSAGEVRRARFGNGWVQTAERQWVPLNRARFTASSATWEARDSINAGVDGDWFYLVTGGGTRNTLPLRSTVERTKAAKEPPSLPFLPRPQG
jgi:hypothetical protein